jgi:invasion protein IalB
MWKEGAGDANAAGRPFMAAMKRQGTRRRAERGRVLLITRSKGRFMTFPFERRGALVLAAAVVLAASGAMAQTTKPAPGAPAAPGPAAPAAPGPGAPAAGAPSAPQGPVKVELTPIQPQWTKVCGKNPESGKEVCYTTRDFGQSADQTPTLAIAVYQMTNEDRRIARIFLPLGLLLRPGFRLVIDKGEPIDGKFSICFANGCIAEADLNGKSIADLKKSQVTSIIVRNQGNVEVTFDLPTKDFGAAFDGPAMDPKQFEQQNEELQKQLEERAREQRQKLEQQQSGGAPPAAAPTAPATPAK